MSFLQFYMNSSGDNLNSGTTAADAGGSDSASYTSTAGNFDGATIFTPTDGQTTSTKVSVGDYVSLYNTGDASVRCIAQVTAVGAGVNGTITIDAAVKYGTVPTVNSGSRNCRKGGAFASLAITASGAAFNTGTIPLATKVNIRGSSTSGYTTTYANTTTARTFALAGATTAPLWWSGYNVTPGDLDSSPTVTRTPGTNMPSFTWTTAVATFSGNQQKFSSIDFNGAATSGAQFNVSSVGFEAYRCRFTATGANSASVCLSGTGGSNQAYIDCYFSANALANVFNAARTGTFIQGCTFSGGLIQISSAGSAIFVYILRNIFLSPASHAIQFTAASTLLIDGNSMYGTGVGDFYNITTLVPVFAVVTNNEVYGVLNGINNTTGTNTNLIVRNNNAYGAVTTAAEVGLGDSPAFDGVLEGSVLPFTSTTDLTILPTALGYKAGAPGLFENSTTRSFAAIGASTPNPDARIFPVYQQTRLEQYEEELHALI